uniref:Uncharacterized protein n=4 Tax=Caenorhabditis japonica TaxID=281687 RepID=A0A8R1DWV0_CAEJA
MRLLDTIKALNAAAARAFKLRPQNSFMATRTLLYDGEDTINRFAEEIADFLEEYEVLEEQLVQFTAESMLGIMVSRVKMAKKCGLLQMVLKWDKLFMDYYLPPVKKESEKKLVDVKNENEKEKGEEMEMEDHEETSEEEFATSTDSDSPELFDESDEMDRVLDFTSHKTIRVRQ